ncbi:protein-L-isoaspartate O-methyltransferase family protein [Endothiovibrio diazotrophicus]
MSQLNFDQARHNMIEQQIRPWEVLDPRVLEVMALVPREAFVDPAYATLALADVELPIGHGERMMPPRLEGRLLQALDLRPGDRVLEIGTGSGFLTACLAALGGRVTSVEQHADLSEAAAARLAALEIPNVELAVGDAAAGWEAGAPFDAIAVTGSLPLIPDTLRRQLKEGGRLFAVVGSGPVMEGTLVTRTGAGSWSTVSLLDTWLAPLTAPRTSAFVL